MHRALRALIRERAGDRCEYCHLPAAALAVLTFHIEHVIPRQHGGQDDPNNLALACYHCNLHKGPNLAGIDRESRRIVPLFNPRRQRWNSHFRWEGVLLRGKTATGRGTVDVLAINRRSRVSLRRALIAAGGFSAED